MHHRWACLVIFWLQAVVLSIPCAAAPQSNQASFWVAADHVQGRLISATLGTGSAPELLAAVELKLQPKWKTYWRTPGDAGLPPELDWAGSQNVEQATLLYPAPIRFQLFGLQTFGYEERVVFPVRIKLNSLSAPVDLKLKLTVLVCSDVCVPQTLALALHVPAGDAQPSPHAHLIQRAVAAVPSDAKTSGLRVLRVAETQGGEGQALVVDVVSDAPLATFDVIPEVQPFTAFSAPEITRSVDQKTAQAVFKLAQPLPAGETLVGREISVTVTAGSVASQHKTSIIDGGGAAFHRSVSTLAMMLGVALLGGLILNLMPCVLPVLSVKLLSLVSAKAHAPEAVRTNFLATALGIVSALLALAAILIAIKSAGLAVGWGMQFQQPLFIATMAVIITLFACNLWGFFEISLPSSLSNWAGASGKDDSSYISHFLTGVFVTILATPCSAPFVGIAVGFALASGTLQTLAVFAALGVGLALPYIAIAAMPSLVRFLPRPGPWMVRLRQILGFALLATAIWLLTVLARQVGWPLTWLSACGLAIIIGVLGLHHQKRTRFSTSAMAGLVGVVCAASILLPSLLPSPQTQGALDNAGPISWSSFDEKQIRSLVAQGKTVFVDVTADWCITCKANKRLVINQDEVADRIGNGVIAMRADWTSPDPKITAFLARFGRYGIPMNVVFGPGNPQGIVLPELLTTEHVLEALSSASKSPATNSG